MKKARELRTVAINSILDCKAVFHQMPPKLRTQQMKLLNQIDKALTESASSVDDDLFNRPLPAISNDKVSASLSASERALANSLENGGTLDAADSYHQSKPMVSSSTAKKI
jgi:hypothetical protein